MTRNLSRSSVARRCAYIPRPTVVTQKRTRLNEVDSFEWPHHMWQQATVFIAKVTFVQVVIYGVIAYGGLSQVDGLRAVDIIYLMTATITTVGLGDISPQRQLSRITAIFLLPYGLIVVSLVISLFTAHSNSQIVETNTRNTHMKKKRHRSDKTPSFASQVSKKTRKLGKQAMKKIDGMKHHSVAACILLSFLEYLFVLLVGSSFFLFSYGEEMFDHKELGERLTIVDSLYFTSVVSTTVGYGTNFYAVTDTAKWFMSFFFVFSSFVVANIISDLSGLYLDYQENEILMKVMKSTADVYKTDLDRNLEVDESEFVLFKLLQLQKVDTLTLERLIVKFDSLDVEKKGFLHIGVDIPHAIQSADCTRRAREEDSTEAVLWAQNRETFAAVFKSQHPERFEQIRHLNGYMTQKCNRCDGFLFSRQLWSVASYKLSRLAFAVFCVYAFIGTYGLVYLEGLDALKGAYFLSASITTVGFGDVAPTKQSSRAFAIFILPFGLILIGIALSIFAAHYLATNPVVPTLKDKPSVLVRYTKFPRLLLEMYLIVTPCVLFVHWEQHLSWIDSFYFATVTAITIGYGDIVPNSDNARLFLLFYMPIATLAMGNVIRKLSRVMLVMVEERINLLIIESPTSLYRADVLDSGFLDEPDYILYKLQQMQKLDKDMLDRMIDLFEELDTSHSGFLRVGVDVPSRSQQEAILAECDGKDALSPEFNVKWEEKRKELALQTPRGRSMDGGLDIRKKLDRSIKKMSARESQAEGGQAFSFERKLSNSEETAIAFEQSPDPVDKKRGSAPTMDRMSDKHVTITEPVTTPSDVEMGVSLLETKVVSQGSSGDDFETDDWRSPVRRLSSKTSSEGQTKNHEESKQHFSMMSFQWS